MNKFLEKFNFVGLNRQTIVWITIILSLVLSMAIAFLSPWKVLLVAIGLFFIFVSFSRPKYAVLFLAVYVPLEPFILKFIPDEIYVFARYFSESLIYILLASVIFKLLKREKRIVSTPIDLPFILFIIVALSSLVINLVPPFVGILGLRQILRFILFFYIIVYLNLDKKFIKKILFAVFIIFLLESVIGISQAIIGGPADEFLIPTQRIFLGDIQLTTGTNQFWQAGSRIFATMGRYDQLGTFVAFFMLILVGFLYEFKNGRRNYFWFLLALGIPTLVLTNSRASWFGFLFGFLLISLLLKKDKKVLILLIVILALIVGYLIYTGIAVQYLVEYPGQSITERFFEAFSYERWRGEYYGFGRLYFIVKTPMVVVKNYPIFGAGPGQYGGGAAAALHNTSVYGKLGLPFGIYGSEGYIDNNWFSLWGETGTLGLILYVWIFAALFTYALKVFRKTKDPFIKGLALGFLGCILAVAFQAFLATYLEVRTLALYLWMVAGFVVILGGRENI